MLTVISSAARLRRLGAMLACGAWCAACNSSDSTSAGGAKASGGATNTAGDGGAAGLVQAGSAGVNSSGGASGSGASGTSAGASDSSPGGAVGTAGGNGAQGGAAQGGAAQAGTAQGGTSSSAGSAGASGAGSCADCNHDTTYCRATIGGAVGRKPRYACQSLPTSCEGTPSCVCLSKESCGAQCTGSPASGFTLTCLAP
jgi:hypothetical protein